LLAPWHQDAALPFNADASNPGGFSTVYQTTNPLFTARLGYLGVDFGPAGKVSVGKQNSVHYDITGYTTDQLNVFGGQASATYVGGTDGGVTASGRADQVVQYRNNFLKILDVAGQVQFRSNDTGHTADSLGASAQVTVLPGGEVRPG
jgi:predicted porin